MSFTEKTHRTTSRETIEERINGLRESTRSQPILCLYSLLEAIGQATLSSNVCLVSSSPDRSNLHVVQEWKEEDSRSSSSLIHDLMDCIAGIESSEIRKFSYFGTANNFVSSIDNPTEPRISLYTFEVFSPVTWLKPSRRQNYLCLVDAKLLQPDRLLSRNSGKRGVSEDISGLATDWLCSVDKRRREFIEFLKDYAGPNSEEYNEARAENRITSNKWNCVLPLTTTALGDLIDEVAPVSTSANRGEAKNYDFLELVSRCYEADRPCQCASENTGAEARCRAYHGLDPRMAVVRQLAWARASVLRRGFQMRAPDVDSPEEDNPQRLRREVVAKLVEALGEAKRYISEAIDFSTADDMTLLKFFLLHAIDELILRSEVSRADDTLNWQPDRVTSLRDVAELATMLLSDEQWTLPRVEALIGVLSEYGYQVLGIPRRLDLGSHLRQAMQGEAALHSLKPYYRDHFFHAVEVCLIGFALLKAKLPSGDGIAGTFGQVLADQHEAKRIDSSLAPYSDEALLRQWWIASLTHDVGYGLEILKGSLQLISFFDTHSGVREFCQGTKQLIRELGNKFDYPEEIRDEMNRGSDHGILAAAHLHEILLKIGQGELDRFKGAVRAVAFHNSRVPVVDAGADPIAALLILCDSLQEWRRATLGFSHAAGIILTRMIGGMDRPDKGMFGPVERAAINLRYDLDNHQLCWPRDEPLTIELTLSDQVNRNSGVFFLWIDATYNLQRVNFEAFPVDIQIVFKTPHPEGELSQLARLADCVEELGMTFVHRWLSVVSTKDDTAPVAHQFVTNEKGRQYEKLTIRLKQLGKNYRDNPLLGGTIGDFIHRLRQWPGYWENLDMRDDSEIRPVV